MKTFKPNYRLTHQGGDISRYQVLNPKWNERLAHLEKDEFGSFAQFRKYIKQDLKVENVGAIRPCPLTKQYHFTTINL